MASVNARSTRPPSATVDPIRPQQTSVAAGASLTCLASAPTGWPTRPTLFVCRSCLGPQVNLGPIGLNLPPHGKRTEPDKTEQEQLLHNAHSFTSGLPRRMAPKGFHP